MKTVILSAFVMFTFTACVGGGYPAAEVPNLDTCYPGHETSKDCHNRRHINP